MLLMLQRLSLNIFLKKKSCIPSSIIEWNKLDKERDT